MKESKKAGESYTEMSQLVLPNDTNLLGNLLGGQLMHWIDIVGAWWQAATPIKRWPPCRWTGWISAIPSGRENWFY